MRPKGSDSSMETMRGLNPAPAAAVRAALSAEDLERARLRALALVPVQPASPRALGRRSRPALLAGFAAVAAVTVALVLGGALSGSGTHPSYAAAAVEVARANPRLLLTAPGWKVTDAGEFEPDEGQMTFSDGKRVFTLSWYPRRLYRSLLHDRANVSPLQHSHLLGVEATTVDYGRAEYATMLAPIGRVFVEARARLGSRAAYEAALRSLRPVGIETWLDAMPPGVVRPGARAGAVERLLRGVPLPPRFDRLALERRDAVLDKYALAVEVADAVACGWTEAWLGARKSGNAAGASEAVEAMATSPRWPSVKRMEREVPGGWSRNILGFARQLRAGRVGRGSAGEMIRPDGSGYKLRPAWAVQLDCKSRIRRVPLR